MKKLAIIFLLFASILICPIKVDSIYADTVCDVFYNIQSPKFLCGNENEYFVYQDNGDLVRYSNEQFTSSHIENILDMCYFNNKLYYLSSNTVYDLSGVVKSFDITVLGFTVSNETIFAFSKTEVSNGELKRTFTNIKDICVYENYLYVIDGNTLKKVSLDLTSSSDLKTISHKTDSSFKLMIKDNNFYILEDDTIKVINTESTNQTVLLSPSLVFDRSFISGEVFLIADATLNDDYMLVADKKTGSIQKFKISGNELVFDKLLVASQGADNNRLYYPQSFCMSSKGVIVADTGNNRIMLKSNNTKLIDATAPTIVTSDNNNSVFALTSNEIVNIDLNNNKTTTITKPENVMDLKSNQVNDLYALTETGLLQYVEDNWTLIFETTNALSLQCDASGQYIYLQYANGIKSLNLSTKQLEDCYTSDKIIDFALDYKNNIYTLEDMCINKINEQAITKSITLDKNYSKMLICLNNGDIDLLDTEICTIKHIQNNDFADNLSNFKNDLSYFSDTRLTTPCEVAVLKSTNQVYKYPFNISPLFSLNKNDKVIVLNKECAENSKFAYCIINSFGGKNTLGYIETTALDFTLEDIIPSFAKVKVITALAYIYKYPTSLETDGVSNTYQTLGFNDVVDILSYSYNIKDSNGTSFYCVRLNDNTIGYINTRTAMNSELDVYQKSFQPNGKVEKSLEEDKIYCFDYIDGEYIKTEKQLANGQNIFLNGEPNTDSQYTKVVYLNDKNEQISTYIETKYIYLNDLTKHKFIGLMLLLVALIMGGIITALILTLKKKKSLS